MQTQKWWGHSKWYWNDFAWVFGEETEVALHWYLQMTISKRKLLSWYCLKDLKRTDMSIP